MAEYSNMGAPPPPPPMMGLHTGRIPSFKNNHGENFQNRCGAEPPACVQNAMMTKDKKPFTYTPGGLDLSQIRTPSMARKLNRQQQQMDDSDNYAQYRPPNVNGGGPSIGSSIPPPPPPSGPPPPPPPPALVINVAKPVKSVPEGERPEIVIPDNPISMLRKTRSPYHWESEMADRISQGSVPKFVEKSPTPSPVPPPQMRPLQQFSQRPPQQQPQMNQQPQQQQINMKSPSTSPIWKPEPQYPQNNNVNSPSPQMYYQSPSINSTPSNEMFNRQNSQFNSTPSPWGNDSASSTTTTTTSSTQSFTPTTETSSMKSSTPISSPTSPWKPEVRNQDVRYSPMSPTSPVNQEYRNSPVRTIVSPMVHMNIGRNQVQSPPTHPPFYNTNKQEAQQQNIPPWRMQNQTNNVQSPQPVIAQSPTYVKPPSPPKQMGHSSPFNRPNQPEDNPEVRYQTHMTIPVTPRKVKNQNEQTTPTGIESPKEALPWVRGENNTNKSVPQPPWCQKAMESRRSVSRDLEQSPEKSSPVQAPWCPKPSENRRSVPKECIQSPVPNAQPAWVTQNRGYDTLPKAHIEKVSSIPSCNDQIFQHTQQIGGGQPRIIPIQMETVRDPNKPQMQTKGQKQQPQLRIIIDMNQQGQPQSITQVVPQGENVPQHRIRMIQPQMVRMEGSSLSTPPVQEQNNVQSPPIQQQHQPKTRIIPIQMEPTSPVVTSPRVIYHKVNSEAPPRQSKAFRVLQVITGTDAEEMENHCGYTDL